MGLHDQFSHEVLPHEAFLCGANPFKGKDLGDDGIQSTGRCDLGKFGEVSRAVHGRPDQASLSEVETTDVELQRCSGDGACCSHPATIAQPVHYGAELVTGDHIDGDVDLVEILDRIVTSNRHLVGPVGQHCVRVRRTRARDDVAATVDQELDRGTAYSTGSTGDENPFGRARAMLHPLRDAGGAHRREGRGGIGNLYGGLGKAEATNDADAYGGAGGSLGGPADADSTNGTATATGGAGIGGGDGGYADAYSTNGDAVATGGAGATGGNALAATDHNNGADATAIGGVGTTKGGNAAADARRNAIAYGGNAALGSNGDGGDADAYTEIGDTTSMGWFARAFCGDGDGVGLGGTTANSHGGAGVAVYAPYPIGQSGTTGAKSEAK